MVIVEADGTAAEAARIHEELTEVLSEDAVVRPRPDRPRRDRRAVALARRRLDRRRRAARRQGLARTSSSRSTGCSEAIDGTVEIGRRHGLPACSWGHAGDGNLHSTFLIDLDDPAELDASRARRPRTCSRSRCELGGTVSGEHGIGLVKSGQLARQWEPAAVAMHEAIKRAFDPKGLLNPGKKLARI